MPEYDNNMRGVLFKNDRGRGENSPPYTGNCEIDGVEYWVSAWVKESNKGQKFFSLAFRAKDEKPQRSGGGRSDYDSDIPFAPEKSL